MTHGPLTTDLALPGWTARRPSRETAVKVAAVLAVAVAVAFHLYAALKPHGVVWTDDEIGILANARLIAGVGEPYELANLSYYPGWSIVLAPIWWFTQDPAVVYRIAVFLSALCGMAVIAPFAGFARRLGVSRPVAVIVAAVVAVAPSRTTMSGYALTENALTLVIAITCWLSVRYARSRTVPAAALLGASAAAAFVVHGRMIPLFGAVLLWFVAELFAGRRRAGIVGAATSLGIGLLGFALHMWVSAILYGDSGARESTALASFLAIDPRSFAAALVSQTWYVTTAWLGLPLIGLWWLARESLTELRAKAVGWATTLLVAVLGLGFISVTTIATHIARASGRLDFYVYGRYVEPLVVVLALIGLVCLVRGVRRAPLVGVAGVTVAVVLLMHLWCIPTIPPAGWWAPINIPGLLVRMWPGMGEMWTPPWVKFSVTAVIVVLGYFVVRGRPVLVIVPLLGYFALGSASAYGRTLNEFNDDNGATPDLVHVIEQIDPDTLSYDVSGADWIGQNTFQFWLTGRDVVVFDSGDTDPPTDLVIARRDWWRGEAAGAERVAGSHRDETLWVMPGALQRELEAEGALESTDPTSPLDDDLSLVWSKGEPPEPPRRLDGARVRFALTVTNLGDAPWSSYGTTEGGLGTVRLMVWWPTADGPLPNALDLPYTLLPGHSAEIDRWLDVPPGTQAGSPVEIGVIQEGVQELDPGARLIMPLPRT